MNGSISGILYFIALKKLIVKVNDTTDEICTVYGSSATIITFIRNWFRPGNFDLKDEGGHPAMTNPDLIKAMFVKNYIKIV